MSAARFVASRSRSAHPHLIPNYVQLLRRLPVVLLQLTPMPAGELLYDRWQTAVMASGRITRRVDDAANPAAHTCAGVVGKPCAQICTAPPRCNLICRRVDPDWEWIKEGIASEPFNDLIKHVDDGAHHPDFVQSWAVFDTSNNELGRAVVVVDELTAVLLLLAGPPDLSVAHQTRYLLHTTIVHDLIEQGVRHLVVESILGAPAGHKYFAARLGYRACRMKVERAPSRRLTAGEAQAY